MTQTHLESRLLSCNPCIHNQDGVCQKQRELYPDRPSTISYGVTLPKSYCPIGEWWKSCSIVWVYIDDYKNGESLRYSIRTAHNNLDYHNIVVCGDAPEWYIGHHIPRRKKVHCKWHDSVNKLQAIINDSKVTDTFLWMYDDTFIVDPYSIQEINNCKYGSNFPLEGHGAWRATADHTLYLLPPGKRRNYSTHYPVVFNKQLLQQVLDDYKPPYLVETLYLNLHGHNPQPMTNEFQFIRDPSNWQLEPQTKILNVKQFSARVALTIKSMFASPSPYELSK